MKKLHVETLKRNVPKYHKQAITDELVDDLNRLAEDPDYGAEFQESLITHTSILEGKERFTLATYINAVKFYSLTACGVSLSAAYIKVFPERVKMYDKLDEVKRKHSIGNRASKFNGSDAVNKIRAQAAVPLHLVNQGTVQLAINTLSDIMVSGRSEVARVSAATALLKELRPPEVQQMELQIGVSDAVLEQQKKQNESLVAIAENQRALLAAGADINDIQQIHTTVVEVEVDEDE